MFINKLKLGKIHGRELVNSTNDDSRHGSFIPPSFCLHVPCEILVPVPVRFSSRDPFGHGSRTLVPIC